MPLVQATFLQVVGKFDNQDAVLGNKADQGDQADLAVNIDRCGTKKGEDEGA